MDTPQPAPWIEVARRAGSPQPWLTGADLAGEYCAQFALRLSPRPFRQRLGWKWGFNAGALLEEAADRQRLFIEAQHPGSAPALLQQPTRRLLALRCTCRPSQPTLDLALVGGVQAASPEAARAAAREYCQELVALLPYDYNCSPALTAAGLAALAGWDLLADCAAPAGLAPLVEVRRQEAALSLGSNWAAWLGRWQVSPRANEQVYRALAGCSRPALLSVTLQPTLLLEQERRWLAETGEALRRAEGPPRAWQKGELEWAERFCAEQAERLQRPFLLRVHLAAPGGVPEWLGRALGAAFTHLEGVPPALAGWQVEAPAGAGPALESLHHLEQPPALSPALDPAAARLRFLAGAAEAAAVLRLPYPNEGGLPGVSFGGETE